MKKRKSDAYLVIGNAHLGMDDNILELFANVANHYNAEVVHLGPLVSEKDVNDYNRVKWALGDGSDNREAERSKDFAVSLQEKQDRVLEGLKWAFGKVTIVVNDRQVLDDPSDEGVEVVWEKYLISKHLNLSSVQPNGEKISNKPITRKCLAYFKRETTSWIAPHPTPAVESFPREGLNQAHNYMTTGSLTNVKNPNNPRSFFQCQNLPACWLVLVDTENGEFHPKQLHVDYLRGDTSHRLEPHVLDDGLVFSSDGVFEVDSEDKANHTTDDHSPWEHMGVLGSVRALNELHQPSVYINGGDAGNFDSVCPHTADFPLDRENFRLVQEFKALRKLLTAQINTDSIVEKILVDSNHHEWVTKMVKKNPWAKGLIDWKTMAETTFSDWHLMIRGNGGAEEIYRFGDFVIRHGDQESGVLQASDDFYKYLGGHYHRFSVFKRAISVGPGCRLGPSYLQGKVTAWQNQMTSLTKHKGVAAASPKIVLHDERKKKSRFAYQGDIFEVDFYKYVE